MKNVLIFFMICFFSTFCLADDKVENISVHNAISSCIKFNKNNIEHIANIIMLNTTWEVTNNVGVCGCKSAALKYDVKIENGSYVSKGIFSTIGRKSFKFVISSDNTVKDTHYELRINCH